MTRINIIPPSELTDQHLIAEYREIFMVPAALKRTLKSKKGYDKNRAPNYTLKTNHVYFFFNKGKYLNNRYTDLITEMKKRGMNPNPDRVFPKHVFPKHLYNDWKPTEQDFTIIRERIAEKIAMKPKWYRKTEYK